MPLVHGVHMRWSLRKDPCFVCEKVDHKKFMIEVERAVMLCPDCVEEFRKRCRMEKVQLVGGEWLMAHAAHRCEGEVCCIHNPTDHHMIGWYQHWRDDAGKMERLCPHGIGHPDPDDITFQLSGDDAEVKKDWIGIHGCDGCCSPPKED